MTDAPIVIRGAREHNLQNVTLSLPRNRLIVFTGVSGSGKSSLAFDTLYAEGQRRYIESLSSYARQFLGQLPRPDVDHISGLAPSIAIQQKTSGKNPRSTVGTITEIHDYLRVLYARVGKAYCYRCGQPIRSQTPEHIVERLLTIPAGTRLQILAPLVRRQKGEFRDLFLSLLKQGFIRSRVDGQFVEIQADLKLDKQMWHSIDVVVDRLIAGKASRSRLAEAVAMALKLTGNLVCALVGSSTHTTVDGGPPASSEEEWLFSTDYACITCGISYQPPSPQLFSFNSPQGMCPDCQGLGHRYDFELSKLIPDESRSIRRGALALEGPQQEWSRWTKHILTAVATAIEQRLGYPSGTFLKTSWNQLPPQAHQLFLYGLGEEPIPFTFHKRGRIWSYQRAWKGYIPWLLDDYRQTRNPMRRRHLEIFMQVVGCITCRGERLNREAASYRVRSARLVNCAKSYPHTESGTNATVASNDRGDPSEKTLPQVCALSVSEARDFFDELVLSETERQIASEVLREIRSRLDFLIECGLDYLTLDRPAPTLSGGESQRIRLASQIGSGLVGVLYILDEPSIGLHPRDNSRLLRSLCQLRDLGNTVIVVEHDEETMRAADHLVDFGPGPGIHGGKVVVEGSLHDVQQHPESITGAYLSGRRKIPVPTRRRSPSDRILRVVGARHHNLKNLTVEFPLGTFICVTGVSGSGKSSLINDILWEALDREVNGAHADPGEFDRLEGLEWIDKAIAIDQSPIGRTPRSNPATYVKVFDLIRDLYTQVPEAKLRGYQSGRFSFNVAGGRCDACEGNGATRLEMDFLADIWVTCPVCQGRRFNRETLEIRYRGLSIADVLDLDVESALKHFEHHPKIRQLLQTLHDVGLDYMKLGQPSPTLSGGEAQRVKLARELGKRSTGKTVYILDEPTTGLHFWDVEHLLRVLHGFVESGNTVIVVEHNIDVIKTADWIIDLGPEGGDKGGEIVVTGPPETVATCAQSHTGQALRAALGMTEQAQTLISGDNLPTTDYHPTAKPAQESRAEAIVIRGAAEHNLKHLDVTIPRERLSVFCGPSGSGKSSLALDTLYAEGQRRYVESLSSYARQFIGQMPKPRVEQITGLQPAIAIEQKTTGQTPRSTVGTVTEIYDYLRVIYARLGTQYCPDCQIPVRPQTIDEIIEQIHTETEGTRLLILAPYQIATGQSYARLWQRLRKEGFRRVRIDGKTYLLEDVPEIDRKRKHEVEIVIDRYSVSATTRSRLAEAVESALAWGQGMMRVAFMDELRDEPHWRLKSFSLKRACIQCGRSFEELSPQHFSFNSPLGWCVVCEGLGTRAGINLSALLSDEQRSLRDGVIAIWPDPNTQPLLSQMLQALSTEYALPLERPFSQLEGQHQRLILYGGDDRWIPVYASQAEHSKGKRARAANPEPRLLFSFRYRGLYPLLEEVARFLPAIRHQITELRGEAPCDACQGSRLRDDAAAVRWHDKTLHQVCQLPLGEFAAWLSQLRLQPQERKIVTDLWDEIHHRLKFLIDVGLHYLTLGRTLPTLSGGEAQRIRLAGQLGRSLTGVLYVLDEPTIGLHPSDNQRLLQALKQLRDTGNTIVLVEHDREVLQAADRLYDFGPGAGRLGGTVTAEGTPQELQQCTSLTGRYLSGREQILIPSERRMPSRINFLTTKLITNSQQHTDKRAKLQNSILVDVPHAPRGWLVLTGARLHNLHQVTLRIPLGTLTAVTGVSGSGKSSLIERTLAPALLRYLGRSAPLPGPYDELWGAEQLQHLVVVDQQPIGSTPASNPATYTGVFDEIRRLFASLTEAKVRGYTPARFSFNRTGGRCEACEGQGQKKIEMHFLPDVWITCDVCKGARYNPETLAVKFRDHSIADVLNLTIREALELFHSFPKIRAPLALLTEIGLDYLTLGQPAPTLSGGEAQRVKLAAELARLPTGKTLYLLDEPTTGLHFDDIRKLLKVLQTLVERGHTVLVIEHNLDVIKTADWVIDLGPHAGHQGGWVIAEGMPEDLVAMQSLLSADHWKDVPVLPGHQRVPSLTAACLAPILAGGERGPREILDPHRMLASRSGDRERPLPVSRFSLSDEPRDHLQARASATEDAPTSWDESWWKPLLASLPNTKFRPPVRHAEALEVFALHQPLWFLRIETSQPHCLTLRIRIPRRALSEHVLNQQFGSILKQHVVTKEGLSLPKMKLRHVTPAWDELILVIASPDELHQSPFRALFQQAMERYLAHVQASQQTQERIRKLSVDKKRSSTSASDHPAE
ncbi:MAG: UvrABC system protein A [Planctomycetaceae bacterium]|nr:MAG: UvrABC system protein A [Planctomycetaceae bacterium]